jgi:hypothetical protein
MDQAYETTQEAQGVQDPEGRWAEVELLAALREAQSSGGSLLQVAQEHGVPEATVRHWVSRAQASGASEAFAEFVESPEGLKVLHHVVTAATFVLTQVVGGGVRSLCTFLELSGLWRVVAAGYGTQQQTVKTMEEAIVAFGTEEKKALAANMRPKSITVTQDETFHDKPCLVAMEPVSNFILVEEHAEDRRAETWNAAMERGLEGLPVTVFQSTSDEGAALLSHARTSLGAHHSPDLFHPQQDISRATSLPLQRQVEAAKQAADRAAEEVDLLQAEAEEYQAECRPGRPRDYAKRIEEGLEALDAAELRAVEAEDRCKQVRKAARAISHAYHPFDLETGAPRDADTVEADLVVQYDAIEQVANEAGLSAKCLALLGKARRLVPQMVSTIALVHALIRSKVEALDLEQKVEASVLNHLIPMHYLEEVARKAATAEARADLRQRAARLRRRVESSRSVLARLDPQEREAVEHVARECAQLFQRSSSNVEGRNGVLALRNHSIHHLSARKLGALTVVHNYGITRADGTTAAQRFFGQPHRNLFEHLLVTLPPPKRPAARRATVH